ncbi:hypothetical protein H8959_007343 [Pygathrix nigripes]
MSLDGVTRGEEIDARGPRTKPGAPNIRSRGRAILQQQGSPVDATIAALVCTSIVNPQSMGLGGGVIFTIYNVTIGKVEVINARETVPAHHAPSLLDRCAQALPLGTGAQWIGVPGELRGYAEAHRRHGRLPWAQLFQPTIALSSAGSCTMASCGLPCRRQPCGPAPTLRLPPSPSQLFFNGTEPLRPQDPLPWPALATTLETVATEGAEVFYTGRLGQMLVEDIAKEGSQLTLQDLAKFQPEVVDALEVPLGDYSLYSPPPPAGGAILSFILNVLRGFNFSAESVARPEGRVNMYHHLVETLKFARGQRWRLRDPRSHPKLQNASQDLLGETLAQLIRQQIDGRGDHQLSHYSLAEAWGHGTGTSHVSVLGEDGSAVAATSTINTPCVGPGGRLVASLLLSSTCTPAAPCPLTCPHGAAPCFCPLSPPLFQKRPPPLTSLAGKAAAGVAPSQDLPGNGQPHSEGCPDMGAQVGLWGPLVVVARERIVAPACFGAGSCKMRGPARWAGQAVSGGSPGSASMAAALERWCIHHGQASSSTTSSWTYARDAPGVPAPPPHLVRTRLPTRGPQGPQPGERREGAGLGLHAYPWMGHCTR